MYTPNRDVSSGLCECECDDTRVRKEVALKVEPRVQPTRRASACMISGSDASTDSTATSSTHDWTGKDSTGRKNTCDPSHSRAGNGCLAKCRHRRAESAQLECCKDSHLVPYVYLENHLVFPLLFSRVQSSFHWAARQQHSATRVSLTYLQQIVYRPFPRLTPSAISQTTTSRQVMHTQTSQNSTMPSEVVSSVAE